MYWYLWSPNLGYRQLVETYCKTFLGFFKFLKLELIHFVKQLCDHFNFLSFWNKKKRHINVIHTVICSRSFWKTTFSSVPLYLFITRDTKLTRYYRYWSGFFLCTSLTTRWKQSPGILTLVRFCSIILVLHNNPQNATLFTWLRFLFAVIWLILNACSIMLFCFISLSGWFTPKRKYLVYIHDLQWLSDKEVHITSAVTDAMLFFSVSLSVMLFPTTQR